MRNDPIIHPKVIIQRRRDDLCEDVFCVHRCDIDPGARVLIGTPPTLERASIMVRWDLPSKRDGYDGPPNGTGGNGTPSRRRCSFQPLSRPHYARYWPVAEGRDHVGYLLYQLDCCEHLRSASPQLRSLGFAELRSHELTYVSVPRSTVSDRRPLSWLTWI
jgi:hypothetical protein